MIFKDSFLLQARGEMILSEKGRVNEGLILFPTFQTWSWSTMESVIFDTNITALATPMSILCWHAHSCLDTGLIWGQDPGGHLPALAPVSQLCPANPAYLTWWGFVELHSSWQVKADLPWNAIILLKNKDFLDTTRKCIPFDSPRGSKAGNQC